MGNIFKACLIATSLAMSGCVMDPLLAGGYPNDYSYPDGGYYPDNRYPDPGYGNDYAYNGQTVRCESTDNRTRNCAINTNGGVQIVRQLSKTQCVQGRNWGYDRNNIWVSGGCRAEFTVGRGGGYGNGNGYGNNQTIRCESTDNRTRNCVANTRGGVQLVRQLSKTTCQQGRNWGYDNSRIWVSGGCRAEFVTGRGGGNSGNGNWNGGGQVVLCESVDNRQRQCNINAGRRGVTLVRQISKTRCVQGQNWGWNNNSVWVSGGCRAEFRAN